MGEGIRKIKISGYGEAYTVQVIGTTGQLAEFHYRYIRDAIRKAREFPEFDPIEDLLPYLAGLIEQALSENSSERSYFREYVGRGKKAIAKLAEIEKETEKNSGAIHGVVCQRGKEANFFEKFRELVNRQGHMIASLQVWKEKKGKELRTLENCFREHTSLLTKLKETEDLHLRKRNPLPVKVTRGKPSGRRKGVRK